MGVFEKAEEIKEEREERITEAEKERQKQLQRELELVETATAKAWLAIKCPENSSWSRKHLAPNIFVLFCEQFEIRIIVGYFFHPDDDGGNNLRTLDVKWELIKGDVKGSSGKDGYCHPDNFEEKFSEWFSDYL